MTVKLLHRKRPVLWMTALLLTIAMVTLAGACNVFAATTGKIAGMVKDEKGNPLSNAKITLKDTSFQTTSEPNGYYVIINIPPESYEVKVELMGYKTVTQKDVKVLANLTTTVEVTLETAPVQIEPVIVEAARPLIKRDLTETTRIIESDQINSIPRDTVNGILETLPGVSVVRSGGGASFHVRGGRSTEVKYLLDGISLDDPIFLGQGARVNVNSLKEMEVITGGFNAEHGNAQSGIINLITKEGTKDFSGRFEYRFGIVSEHHGDPLYGYWRNPDNNFQPDALEIFRGLFLGKPLPYQRPYRGQEVTVEELAKKEGEAKVVFTEILPGVWADRTENPLVPVIDPETKKPKKDPKTGEVIKEKQPFQDSDGTIIDYEKKEVQIPIGEDKVPVDLKQYSNLFNDTKDYNLKPTQIGELALSGPIWGNRLTFSFATEQRRDYGFLPNNDVAGHTYQGKLKFELTPQLKLTLSGLFDRAASNNYGGYIGIGGPDWRFNPQNLPKIESQSNHFVAQISHNLSSGTFYTLGVGLFDRSFSSTQRRKISEDEEKEVLWNPFKNFEENAKEIKDIRRQAYNDTNFAIAGDFNRWNKRNVQMQTFRADLTSQVNPNHQLKVGAEYEIKDLSQVRITNWGSSNIYVDALGDQSKFFEDPKLKELFEPLRPKTTAVYLQDKMEFRQMIVNAGLRFDLFDPNTEYPADELDPLELNPDGTVKIDEKTNQPTLKNPKKASVKTQLNPRLGISYPITERNKLHFTYGHYFQIPRAQDLYENFHYDMRGAIRRMGHPNLKPEKTISYEVGVEHQFTASLVGDITGFSKDIDNLVDSKHVTPETSAANDYSYFINGIYGHVQGVEITLRKQQRKGDWLYGSLSYTYSIAEGKGSSRTLGYLTYYYSQPKVTESWPLDWDQRHIVSTVLGFQLPYGFRMNAIGQYGSGLPYTPNPEAPIKPAINSKRYPSNYNVDAIIGKDFQLGSITYMVYADIRNLFNTKSLYDIIDPVTYDRYGRPLNDKKHTDPLSWSPPRQVFFGVGASW